MWALAPAKALHATGDGTGGDENDLLARLAQLGDLSRPFVDGAKVQAFAVVGDERRSGLDDQSFCVGDAGAGHDSGFVLLVCEQVFGEGGGDCSAPRVDGFGGDQVRSASCNWRVSSRQPSALIALMRKCGMPVALRVTALQEVRNALLAFVRGDQVKLVEDQPAWPGGEFRIVLLEFANDRFYVAYGIGGGVDRRQIDDVQQQAGSGEVLEKADAEAGALCRAVDQPGNVGDDEALVVAYPHHTESVAAGW
jgi:hypothetical protein